MSEKKENGGWKHTLIDPSFVCFTPHAAVFPWAPPQVSKEYRPLIRQDLYTRTYFHTRKKFKGMRYRRGGLKDSSLFLFIFFLFSFSNDQPRKWWTRVTKRETYLDRFGWSLPMVPQGGKQGGAGGGHLVVTAFSSTSAAKARKNKKKRPVPLMV